MWGTLRNILANVDLERFIPTHVGNTVLVSFHLCFTSVHPHACGEHGEQEDRARAVIGSSPRMWGTHQHRVMRIPRDRFIPTHVGNTDSRVA